VKSGPPHESRQRQTVPTGPKYATNGKSANHSGFICSVLNCSAVIVNVRW
jgi:hypothetical protein